MGNRDGGPPAEQGGSSSIRAKLGSLIISQLSEGDRRDGADWNRTGALLQEGYRDTRAATHTYRAGCTHTHVPQDRPYWEQQCSSPSSQPGMHGGMSSGMQMLLMWRCGRNQRVLLIAGCRAAPQTASPAWKMSSPPANATRVPSMPGLWHLSPHWDGLASLPCCCFPLSSLHGGITRPLSSHLDGGAGPLHPRDCGTRDGGMAGPGSTDQTRIQPHITERPCKEVMEGDQSGGPHQAIWENGPWGPVRLGFHRLVVYGTCPIM